MNLNASAFRRLSPRRAPSGGLTLGARLKSGKGPVFRRALTLLGMGAAVLAQETPPGALPGAPANAGSPSNPTVAAPAPIGMPPESLTFDPTAYGLPSAGGTNEMETAPAPLPWLPANTPRVPEWAAPGQPGSPFLRPGFGTSSLGAAALPTTPARARGTDRAQLIPLGPFDLAPSLEYQVLYGTGQLSGPDQGEATWQQTLTPGMTVYAGDHWSVAYRPSLRFYSANGYDDTVDHLVTLGGWAEWQEWRFRLDHASAITSDPLIETGQQTDQTTHSTAVGATWDRGERGIYDFTLSQNLRLTDASSDLYSWDLQNWYDYPLRPNLKVGVGVAVGYDYSDPGTDMANERLNIRVAGPLGAKITYNASAGVEIRHFVQGNATTAVAPVASVGLIYQALEKTAFSVGFAYDVGTSYFTDEYTKTASVQGGITQILSERWTAAISGGYRQTSYESTQSGLPTAREDGSAFANVSLSAKILRTVSATLFYSFRGNNSDAEVFSFNSHQVGLSVTWAL